MNAKQNRVFAPAEPLSIARGSEAKHDHTTTRPKATGAAGPRQGLLALSLCAALATTSALAEKPRAPGEDAIDAYLAQQRAAMQQGRLAAAGPMGPRPAAGPAPEVRRIEFKSAAQVKQETRRALVDVSGFDATGAGTPSEWRAARETKAQQRWAELAEHRQASLAEASLTLESMERMRSERSPRNDPFGKSMMDVGLRATSLAANAPATPRAKGARAQGTQAAAKAPTVQAAFSGCAGQGEIPAAECEALVDFYHATGGEHWFNNEGWLETDAPCSWHGVSCSGGQVSAIDMTDSLCGDYFGNDICVGNGLAGALPESLTDLAGLEVLRLGRNDIGSNLSFARRILDGEYPNGPPQGGLGGDQPIPAFLGDLVSLEVLDLSTNNFHGEVPSTLGNLVNLTELNLGDNRLADMEACIEATGEFYPCLTGVGWGQAFPDWIGGLPNLQTVNLFRTGFVGTLPPSVYGLSQLASLNLEATILAGPLAPEVENWVNLRELRIGNNECWLTEVSPCGLGIGLPNEIGNLAQLEVLTMLEAGVEALPPGFTQLANLRELVASFNWLPGLPADFGNLSSLEMFECRNCGLTEVPASLGSLSNLAHLDLSGNDIADLPAEFAGLGALRYLDLGSNFAMTDLPLPVTELSDLTVLFLYFTPFLEPFPAEIGNMTGLEYLSCGYCGIESGSFDLNAEMASMASLRIIDLGGSSITQVPDELAGMAALEEFWCDYCQGLTGPVPDAFGMMPGLKFLRVFGSGLSSFGTSIWQSDSLEYLLLGESPFWGETIPPEIGQLTTLKAVNLSYMGLVGELPPEIGLLTELEYFSVGSNQLGGTLPEDIGGLTRLTEFNVDRNFFEGTLPAAIANWVALEEIRFGENFFEGPLPTGIGNLPALEEISGYANFLTGPLPADLANAASLETLFLDFNQIDGPLPAFGPGTPKLENLRLPFNQLEGEIPASLAAADKLWWIYLSANNLEGEIPPELGSLPDLLSLDLDRNRLEGEIPAELGNLAQVHTINLFSNSLSGEIPANLGTLPSLTWLRLSGNRLSGELPPTLGDYLRNENDGRRFVLDVRGNQLTGKIPAQLGDFGLAPAAYLFSFNDFYGQVPLEVAATGANTERFGFPFYFCDMSNNNPTLFIPDTPEYAALTDYEGQPICGLFPTSPSGQVSGMQAAVLALVDGGSLPEHRATGVLTLLEQVIAHLDAGEGNAAHALLHAAAGNIGNLVRQGVISEAEAAPLLDAIATVQAAT